MRYFTIGFYRNLVNKREGMDVFDILRISTHIGIQSPFDSDLERKV